MKARTAAIRAFILKRAFLPRKWNSNGKILFSISVAVPFPWEIPERWLHISEFLPQNSFFSEIIWNHSAEDYSAKELAEFYSNFDKLITLTLQQ